MVRVFVWWPKRLTDTGKMTWFTNVYRYTQFVSWDEWYSVYVSKPERVS